MKHLLLCLLALAVGCQDTPKKAKLSPPESKVSQVLSQFEGDSQALEVKSLSAVALAQPQVVARVHVKSRHANARIQWAHVSVPFPKGQVPNEAALYNYDVGHGAVDWHAIKWHFQGGQKHSIAIAALSFPIYFGAPGEQAFNVYQQTVPNPWPWAFGPNLSAFLKTPNAQTTMFAVAKLQGSPDLYVAPLFQNGSVRYDGRHHKALRWRSQFRKVGSTAPYNLSFTVHMDLHNRQDFGNMVVSIGHDQFDLAPVSGGVAVDYVDLYMADPFRFDVRGAGAYGQGIGSHQASQVPGFTSLRLFSGQTIPDGSSHSFRGEWSVMVDPSRFDALSRDAELADPLFGVVERSFWHNSRAGGIVGTVVNVPKPLATLQADLEGGCNINYFWNVDKNQYPKGANKVPSNTGDQPAFSSNMPFFQQQAIMAQSSCPIQDYLHAVMVEHYRPSYHWKGGRRMSWLDTPPTCFWWSGRPHYASSHNAGHCDVWNTRSSGTGFQLGPSPYAGEDDQHWGNPIMAAVYEMTGDTYLKDMEAYRMSMAMWNKMGNYSWQTGRVGSERSVRVMYNAVQLALLNPDHPVAAEVLRSLPQKLLARKVGGSFPPYGSWGIDQFFNAWGVYALECIYGDNRHPLFTGTTPGARCVNNALCEENRGCISWWTGFSQTFNYQMLRHGIGDPSLPQYMLDKYMDMKDFYWDANGVNAGGRRLNDWSQKEGAFTQSWHSGWVKAVEDYGQGHPNWPFFRDKVIPSMRALNYNRPGDVWPMNLKWYQ